MTGRPSEYDVEITTNICVRLAAGEALVRICKDEAMPHVSTVYRWIEAHKSFRDMYARAREDQADTLADEIVAIADEQHEVPRGEEGGVYDPDVARDRLRVDARKWVAAKLKPKKYGERVEHELSGKDGGPIQTLNGSMSPEQAAQVYRELMG